MSGVSSEMPSANWTAWSIPVKCSPFKDDHHGTFKLIERGTQEEFEFRYAISKHSGCHPRRHMTEGEVVVSNCSKRSTHFKVCCLSARPVGGPVAVCR